MLKFLAKFKISTHAIAAGWFALVSAYFSSPEFRSAVNSDALSLYHSLPLKTAHVVLILFGLVAPLYAWYRNGQKGTTVTQTVAPSAQDVAVVQTSKVKRAD